MTATLQQCRQHYEGLSPHIKERKTAQCLLRAIQISESLASSSERYMKAVNVADLLRTTSCGTTLENAETELTDSGLELQCTLTRVTKPEGE